MQLHRADLGGGIDVFPAEDSYGLDSHGLYSYGLGSYGLYHHGTFIYCL